MEQELALSYVDCVWTVLGQAAPIYASRAEKEIVLALVEAGEPLGPTQLAHETGRQPGSMSKILKRMVRDEKIEKHLGGKYAAKPRDVDANKNRNKE